MRADCPRCDGVPLAEKTVSPLRGGDPVMVHVCGACTGVWLDGPTLATICPTVSHLPDHKLEVALLGREGAGIKACLRCGAVPFEFDVAGTPIDFCLRCQGVWLDRGEYEAGMLTGRSGGQDKRAGAYRSAARNQATGETKCAYCGTSTPVDRTFVHERGPACGICHSRMEIGAAEDRAARTMQEPGGMFALRVQPQSKGPLDEIFDALFELFGWRR